jgi:hypothetical protein
VLGLYATVDSSQRTTYVHLQTLTATPGKGGDSPKLRLTERLAITGAASSAGIVGEPQVGIALEKGLAIG